MSKIDWKARALNKSFWIALIPAVLIFIQSVLSLFGIQWDVELLSTQLVGLVNALFVVLAIIGIIVDPTTKGIGDDHSSQADDKQE